jgi:hypothetical protein
MSDLTVFRDCTRSIGGQYGVSAPPIVTDFEAAKPELGAAIPG